MSRTLRWTAALLLVLATHVLIMSGLYNWHGRSLNVAPPASLQIELVPVPVPAPTPPAAVLEPAPQRPAATAAVVKPAVPEPKPMPQVRNPPRPAPRPAEIKPPAVVARPVIVTAAPKATATPAPAAATAPHPSSEQLLIAWQNRLLSHLARFKRYPDSARRRGQQGTNSLRLRLDASGRVEHFELFRSSGSAALDRATLQLLERARPLPAPPAELLEEGHVEVIAPVSYSLDKR